MTRTEADIIRQRRYARINAYRSLDQSVRENIDDLAERIDSRIPRCGMTTAYEILVAIGELLAAGRQARIEEGKV